MEIYTWIGHATKAVQRKHTRVITSALGFQLLKSPINAAH